MKSKKKKISDHPVFESIRKPVAPPTISMGDKKAEEKALPSKRKSKHKKREASQESE